MSRNLGPEKRLRPEGRSFLGCYAVGMILLGAAAWWWLA